MIDFYALNNYGKAFVHNVVVHPLMMVLPNELGTNLHDRNANWAFGLNRYDEIAIEKGLKK